MSVYWLKTKADPVKVRIIDSLSTKQYATKVTRECFRAGIEVVGTEVMGWQRDGWKCGFYSIFNIFVAMWAGMMDIDRIPVTKMPPAFVGLSLAIINRKRAKCKDMTLTIRQRNALLQGEVDGLTYYVERRE